MNHSPFETPIYLARASDCDSWAVGMVIDGMRQSYEGLSLTEAQRILAQELEPVHGSSVQVHVGFPSDFYDQPIPPGFSRPDTKIARAQITDGLPRSLVEKLTLHPWADLHTEDSISEYVCE